MLKKNDILKGIVSALGSNGEGIIKYGDYTVFVPYVLPEEEIEYKVLKVAKNCVYGKVLNVIKPSKDRIDAPCSVFGKCGGCQLQHLEYKKQLKVKEENVKRCFSKIAGIDVEINKTVTGESPFRYRNKLQLPISFNGKETVIGFYAENSHRVVPICDCLINSSWTAKLISAITLYIKEFNLKGYSDFDSSGYIREVTAKELNGNLIICLVLTTKKLVGKDRLIEILTEKLGLEFTLYINVNSKPTNVVYGEEFILVHGKAEYTGEMFGIKYKMGVRSFMQVNPSVCKKLYGAVCDNASLSEDVTVIDAYSGAGLMTALLASKAKKAIGIEIIPEAVEIANQLALDNGLSNKTTNYQGKCEVIMPDIIAKERQQNANVTVVLDPPRKGCDYAVIKAVKDSLADKVIYVSCNPSTLARDVGLLTGALKYEGNQIVRANDYTPLYEINSVTPYDMFAQTKHVETLVVLSRVLNR